MSNFGNHILTDAGKSAEAEAHLPGKKLTFTKLAIGSGILTNPATATGLANHEMDLGITRVSRDATNNNWVRIQSIFNNTSLTAGMGFNFQEIGVFARIDSGPEIMYSWARDLGTGDSIPHYDGANPVIVYPTVIVIIDTSIDIHADIVIGADFDCENIGPPTVGPGWFAQRVGNTFEFKRAVEGQGIELVETADTIRIGQRILTVDLDLYVPLTHPDAPNPDVCYPTIQAAIDYLKTLVIPPEIFATIHVGEGRFDPFTIRHPQGEQIRIIGMEPIKRTITTIGSMSGALAPGGSAIWGVNINTSGIADGDYCTISGTPNPTAWGHFRAESITPTAVNLRCRPYKGLIPIATMSLLNGTVWIWPSKIIVPVNDIGIRIQDGGLGLLQNVSIQGPSTSGGTGMGINMSGTPCPANFDTVAIGGLYFGIRASGGGVVANADNCVVSNADNYGFVAYTNSSMYLRKCLATCCYGGMHANASFVQTQPAGTETQFYAQNLVASDSLGISSFANATFSVLATVLRNNITGISCQQKAMVTNAAVAITVVFVDNTTDLIAMLNSATILYGTQGIVTANPTLNAFTAAHPYLGSVNSWT